MNPKEFFTQELKSSRTLSESLSLEVLRLSVIRVIIFIIFLVAAVWFANARMGWALTGTTLLFPFVFGLVVNRFNKKTRLKELYQTIADRYEKELERLSFQLSSIDGGKSFVDRSHPYTYDLDIFGDHSLFQMLNRTATPKGYQRLAYALMKTVEKDEILRRQHAVKELAEDPSWLMRFFSEGNVGDETAASSDNLEKWLADTEDTKMGPPNWVAGMLGVLMILTLSLVILSVLPYQVLIIPVLINLFVLRKLQDPIKHLTAQVSGNVKLLRGYERMILMLRNKEFRSPLLVDLDDPFNDQSVYSIRTLRKHMDFLNSRSNLFYGLLDLFLLLDVYLVNGFYKWKNENRKDLSRWFGNIADIEVLGSLALHSFANPQYCFPELTSDSQQWEAQGLGHPLIPNAERVTNDFSVDKGSPLAIITGSNMSGKSTFLRTVGINSILAYAGAPVAANRMHLGMFRIFTAMRTEDDLSSHISSFYAELKRIKALLDSLDQHPTLCLLDEILKGTNTEDRHRGAKGLLIQLSETNTAGLVSTHDLALGKWGQEHGFANFSFNSTISNDQIHFDYRISSGICHSFNASQLMKNMGIRLPADGDDPGAT